MLLGVVLLYVGVVLAVNGIWLIGQARAAQARAAAMARRGPAASSAAGQPAAGQSAADEAAKEAVHEAAAGEELAGVPVVSVPRAEASPMFIQNREVAVLNLFTGFVAVVAALTYAVQGSATGNLASVRTAGFVLLFAFTYLWVSVNQFLNAGGRAFGWYCLFVAITAVPAGIFTLQSAHGNTALIWLGINWFAWAVLWAMFWALLALELPVARITGWVAILEGIGTGWALAIAVLEGMLAF
jgi:putative amide transporter protein